MTESPIPSASWTQEDRSSAISVSAEDGQTSLLVEGLPAAFRPASLPALRSDVDSRSHPARGRRSSACPSGSRCRPLPAPRARAFDLRKMAGRSTRRFSLEAAASRTPAPKCPAMCQSESRLPESGTSGSMSGDRKQSAGHRPRANRTFPTGVLILEFCRRKLNLFKGR